MTKQWFELPPEEREHCANPNCGDDITARYVMYKGIKFCSPMCRIDTTGCDHDPDIMEQNVTSMCQSSR